jgi:phosphatidate cytidylyltransferase
MTDPNPNEPGGKLTPTGQFQAQMRAVRADIDRNVEQAKADFERNVEQARVQITQARAELDKNIEQARAQFEAASARMQQRTGRNLIGAILMGLVLGGALVASIVIDRQYFILFGAILLGICSFELATAMKVRYWYVPRYISAAVTVLVMPLAFYQGMVVATVAIFGGLAVILLWQIVRLSLRGHMPGAKLAPSLAASAFAQGYVTLLGAFSVSLAAQPGTPGGVASGQWWVLSFLIVVASVDIGAYASGLNFGKHLMAPNISPKKTWEGFAGAGVSASIAGILVSILILHEQWWFGIILGVVFLFVGTWGDLGESHLKRVLGIKDMSNWLAGHGGFLDRLDSIIPSGVFAFILYFIVQAFH